MRMGSSQRLASRRGRARRARLPAGGAARRARRRHRLGPPPPGGAGERRSGADRPLLDGGADALHAAARRAPRRPHRRACQLRPDRRTDRPPLRRQRPPLRPPGGQTRLLLGDGDRHAEQAARADRRALRQLRPARTARRQRLVAASSSSSPPTARARRRSAPSSPTASPSSRSSSGSGSATPTSTSARSSPAPNAEGVNVADAVGGGAAIATDLSRRQDFQTFGYPGKSRSMQGCESPYVGDDSLTYRIPGPPTIAIRCHWAPGASGGGWLIEGGTAIDGLTSYGKADRPRPHLQPLLQPPQRRPPRRRPVGRAQAPSSSR